MMNPIFKKFRSLRKADRGAKEMVIHGFLFIFAMVPIVTTLAIIASLAFETIAFFEKVSIVEFFTSTDWTPLFSPQHFGVLPLISGTMLVTVGSMIIALPLGLGTAIFLSEYASKRTRLIVKSLVEVLAGIPTVVYGYLALLYITPLIKAVYPQTNVFNAASASIAMGIMIIPMIASLSEDAMSAVPRSLREATYALGANKLESTVKVVIPAAASGIAASFILAVTRAIGETMIVAMAAGATPRLTLNPLESVQTVTAYIVQVSLGDTPYGSISYLTIFAVGSLLFVITFALNLAASRIVKRRKV